MRILIFFLFSLLAFNVQSQTETIESNEKKPRKVNYNIFVQGLCGGCQARIEEAAANVEGVLNASYNIEDQMLTVKVLDDEFSDDELHRSMAKVGHDTSKYLAPDNIYDSLPGCCKYRDISKEESQRLMGHEVTSDVIDQPQQENSSENENDFVVIDDASRELLHEGHTHYDGHFIEGIVSERTKKGKEFPLFGANISILGTYTGTTTDEKGYFSLPLNEEQADLIISYIGYVSDTVRIESNEYISLVLNQSLLLDAIDITYKQKTTSVSRIDPYKVQNITAKELCKAACCNLSESFETNPTVDSGITDAITGARKIEMLGLAGPYVQMTRENMPDIRGMSAVYGLSYIPGPWIENILLNTGTGSVVNGFESITGQINVELKKPENSENLYLNLFFNQGGRMEANANTRFDVGEKWSSAILLHASTRNQKVDSNIDGFIDNPLEQDFIFSNRWKFQNDNGWSSQIGIKGNFINHTAGQIGQFKLNELDPVNPEFWSSDLKTNRGEFWFKLGKSGLAKEHQSLGFQASLVYHDQDGLFGTRRYDGTQRSAYANLIFQTAINGNESLGLRLGASYQYDHFDEFFVTRNFEREESVPGIFMEWTILAKEKLAIVPGIRYDYHNNYGGFITPRLHARYLLTEDNVFRISLGRGLKTASIFSENIGALASNRTFSIQASNTDNPYGLNPEIAWNYGANFTRYILINQKEMVLSLDYYRTQFVDQVVVDYDSNVQQLQLYNLDGESFSNSIQAQIDYELLEGFDVRAAYRYNDVQTQFGDGVLSKPLTSRHRAFINLAYETENELMFDLTLNWIGKSRIPNTQTSPEEFQLSTESPDYFLVNAQVSKSWQGKFDWYLGVENLLNYKQQNPILNSENPFDDYFDSTFIWGPIFGRLVYSGIRFRI